MKESKFYQEVLEEGREEGRTVGIVEGRAAGRVEATCADIRQVIEIRFGAEAVAEIQTDLQRVAAPEELSRLHRLAVQCRRLTEFRRALAAVRSGDNS